MVLDEIGEPVQAAIKRELFRERKRCPSPSLTKHIQKDAAKGRRIKHAMHVGADDVTMMRHRTLLSSRRLPVRPDLKEGAHVMADHGLPHVDFVPFDTAARLNMNAADLS